MPISDATKKRIRYEAVHAATYHCPVDNKEELELWIATVREFYEAE